MNHPIAFLGRYLRFLWIVAALSLTSLATAEEAKPVTAFSPDAGHLWNRLFTMLTPTPPAPDGIGIFRAPPPAKAREAMLPLLAEFVKSNVEQASSLQRAVMQRQLLTHFHAAVERERMSPAASKPVDHEFMAALVPAIRKIALTAEDIRKLPDNYSPATALPGVVTTYDPKKPAPFLPEDLLADDGPWIALDLTPQGGRQGVAAEFHFRFFRGSTSFEVRMRHPEGRAAGEAYLKKLAEMPEPYLKEPTPESRKLDPRSEGPFPNPQTPQFPPGTAWALLHRAVLADSTGMPVVSPLVEGVQIRVYRLSADDVPETAGFKAEVAALYAQNKEVEALVLAANRLHTAFEWMMSGTQLLENKGFHLSDTEDTPFGGGHPGVPLVVACLQCHGAPGIHSVNTRSGRFHEGPMTRPPQFQPATRARLDEVTIAAALKANGWSQLRARWEK